MADTLTEPQRAWIAALRSGEYQQGQGVLRDENGLVCCLGVACDLAVKAGVLSAERVETKYSHVAEKIAVSYDGDDLYPPIAVVKWLGLSTERGTFGPFGEVSNLAGLNDAGETFERIADIIESEPEGLFA